MQLGLKTTILGGWWGVWAGLFKSIVIVSEGGTLAELAKIINITEI